jgi:hypothetical protein
MGDRVSRGDAETIFKAGHAGVVIMGHAGVVRGAPADIDLRAAIRPYADSEWDGRHLCAEDWHVLVAAWFFLLMSRILSSRSRMAGRHDDSTCP